MHVQDAVAAVVKFNNNLCQVRGADDIWARQERFREVPGLGESKRLTIRI